MKTSRITIVLVLLFAAFQLFISCGDPPGRGEKANKGYALCDRLINDIDSYQKAQGKLPDSLGVITAACSPEFRKQLSDYMVKYLIRESGVDYDLTFTYTGPGVNNCTYSSAAKKWYCSGYY